MCGILVYSLKNPWDTKDLSSLIKERGPDYYGTHETVGYCFESAVLSLRRPLLPQPVVNTSGCLAFNGEIYGIDGCDTGYFHQIVTSDVTQIPNLEGEFAFAWWDGTSLWFGRDQIGRRSLLYAIVDSKLLVTSVSDANIPDLVECDAGALYQYTGGELHVVPRSVNWCVSRSLEPPLEANVTKLLELLTNSVRDRMVRPNVESAHRLAVLFSGGLDCTLLAKIMDMVLPAEIPIDLINVAFENKRTGSMWDTPDRLLAKRSVEELRALSSRTFELVEVNISYEETLEHTEQVKRLMWPSTTVMDFSIALAFYFAARGKGHNHHSTSPILISGLGADELFGGYSRHLGAATHGAERLASELELDFGRLGSRNLGRDDRVCATWGKEVRYPFLDKTVVDWSLNLGLAQKNNGSDTKIILRQAAKSLGLTQVCDEKKRAIQFGARSAKMDPGSGKIKGTDIA